MPTNYEKYFGTPELVARNRGIDLCAFCKHYGWCFDREGHPRIPKRIHDRCIEESDGDLVEWLKEESDAG